MRYMLERICQGDLDQTHSLELYDQVTITQLAELCARKLQGQPELLSKILDWFSNLMNSGSNAIKLDLEALQLDNSQESDSADESDLPIDRLIQALTKMVSGKGERNKTPYKNQQQIVRQSSVTCISSTD